MSLDVYPEEVRLLEAQRELHILWDDGHLSTFSLAYIRGWCPCANCQGHFTDNLRYQEVPPSALLNAQPVGNYGMQLVWADRHDTGIYSFDDLRRICTCSTCDPEGKRLLERVRPKS